MNWNTRYAMGKTKCDWCQKELSADHDYEDEEGSENFAGYRVCSGDCKRELNDEWVGQKDEDNFSERGKNLQEDW